MADAKKIFITTPLYYVNADPHIGHAYTTLAADIYARHKRRQGHEVHFLTGTDEHGPNIEKAAKAAGASPREWCDEVSGKFRALWKRLDVRFDDFIRTTEPRHEQPVRRVFAALRDKGFIYKGEYEGWYCLPCENFWLDSELAEGRKCPVHARPVERVKEEGYFFKLSRFETPLLEHFEKHPEFLLPKARASEIVNFVKSGLRDISISRSSVSWGIPVPGDEKHTIYVWFDALLNYATAAQYDPEKPGPNFAKLWPADVHLVGKEIFRFHAVTWPAMLMALGLPLPKSVFAHGWWTVEGEKMSKSRGNFIDPWAAAEAFGVDALRYLLFREMPFGNDGDYSAEAMRKRYNADLANDLGNLVSRTVNMIDKYLGGKLPSKPPLSEHFLSTELARETAAIHADMDKLAFSDALTRIWAAVGRLNKHIDKQAPWKMFDTDPDGVLLLLFDLVWSLRIIAGWIEPFMPTISAHVQSHLGVRQAAPGDIVDADAPPIAKIPPLFPRK